MPDPSQHFLDNSRRLLLQSYLPRIERCLEGLSEERVWWRANDASNSIGNLLLHLAGNIRQWIISGVGGAADVRQRQGEFDERGPLPVADVWHRLKSAVEESAEIIVTVPHARLTERCQVQGRDVTVMQAIYGVIEHFSMHTGQIILLSKMWKGDLGFYDVSNGTPRPTWQDPRPERTPD